MAVTNKLTALGVYRMKEPGRYADGGNLYLQVSETGTKSWLFRYMLAGKPREMGLGSVGAFTLAEARERARLQRQRLADGIDPIDHRRAVQAETAMAKAQAVPFEDCAQRYIDSRRAGWKNAKHADQWGSTLRTWAYPIIGKLPVGSITTDLVMQVLEQRVGEGSEAPTLWNAKTETANRVRGRIENILDWATARKLRQGDNPARWKGLLDKLLPARSQVAPTEPHPALPYNQLPEFMSDLRKRNGTGARALEFLILTATRSHNVVGGQRPEIDRQERTWTIRAAVMKGRKGQRTRDHVIPLSHRALEILEGMPDGEHLFPGDDAGEPLSNAAMAAVIDRMNEDRETRGLPGGSIRN